MPSAFSMAVSSLVVLADDWDMHDWGAGWWIAMMIGMVVIWAMLIVGVVWVVRELTGNRGGRVAAETPIAVLERRLAQGDISVEEYELRRDALSRSER